MLTQILFATTNDIKLQEVRYIFSRKLPYIKILSIQDLDINLDNIECGDNYMNNAINKAKEIASKINIPVLTDDIGYEFKHLNHLPGLYKSNDPNNMISKKIKFDRSLVAYQCCAMVFKTNDDNINFYTFYREEGTVTNKIHGKSYDCWYMDLFIPKGKTKPYNRLGINAICKYSARAKCVNQIIKYIKEYL